MPRKPLTEEEKSVVRNKACVAARRIMDEQGAEKVTIRGIAREIGMSAMSLYTYFDSKADILSYLQTQAVEELAGELDSAGAAEKSAERVVRALGETYIAFATDKADEFRLAFRSDEGGAPMPQAARECLDAALEPLRAAVKEMVKGARSPSEVDRIVAAIWSAWHGYALLKQAGCVEGDAPGVDLRTVDAAFRDLGPVKAPVRAGAH